MSAGRRPHDEPYRKKTFYLPESVVTRVDMRLDLDLLRGTPKHGAWSALVSQLLKEWLDGARVVKPRLDEGEPPREKGETISAH